jgi:hypothetical protein
MMRCQLRDHEQSALTSLGLAWESMAETFGTVGEARAVVATDGVADAIVIGTLKENEQAISLYRRAGFIPTEEEGAAPGFENFQKTIAGPGRPKPWR